MKGSLTLFQKVELTEIQKCISKEVRKNIRKFEEELTKEKIEKIWSIRKVRKIFASGFEVMNKLRDEKGY